jgi:protein-tyrosine phosphatase/membrane-associated phospholipid phosphatase
VAGNLAAQTQPGRAGFQVSEGQHVIATARPWMEAIVLSAALSLLFIIIYGGCNALAARWADLDGCFFAWELQIPFVPTLIIPYMSIDLFFVLSPLLCKEVIELRTLARRITAAILVAGLMFITFPLTTGYARPEVSGWTGRLFEFLWSFDKPHNLVPSLHVALASLLWPVYARHTRGWLQKFIHLWFTLIVASALFTYQHHLLDMATGAMLGQGCIFAFPERREPALAQSASANLRVALLYAFGAVLLAVLAIALGFWFWILLWPAVSLALVALAYLRGNSAIFRKTGGRLPVSTRVVLGPYLCGAFIRRLVYNRRRPPWVEIAPGVYCGRLLTNHEAIILRATGITSVLDMTAEHAEAKAFLDIEYLNIPVLDLTSPSREQLDVAVAFINEQVQCGGVYVHCALGISRSAAATAAYLAFRQPEPTAYLG